ncbi:MAG: hypothetical protein QOF92_4624, partial [Pseudonocardiales bacterium]|nr:hypothetical protein [Pseudonocardiales bacterium]
GAVGLRPDNDNMPLPDQMEWDDYRSRVQRAAEAAGEA